MLQQILTNITISTIISTTSEFEKRYRRRAGRCAALLMVCSGLSCRPALPTAPMLPTDTEGYQSAPMEDPIGMPEDPPPPPYLLPGDLLHLRILSAQPYEPIEIWVDSTGQLHIPFGGDIAVLGIPLGEVEARVEDGIRKYDRFAKVALSVRSYSGHRAIITGAVDKPGVYDAKPGARVADIVASAGGTRILGGGADSIEASDMDGARIVRDGKTLPVSVKRALFGETLHNIYVRPGDIIFVPWAMGRQIAVLGDVHSARNVPFHPGIRLTEALAAAGGPTRTADNADVRIVRGPLSRPTVYRANLDDLIRGKTTDVVLAAGDVIFVTEHWFATTMDVVNRLTPLLATAAVTATLLRPNPTTPQTK